MSDQKETNLPETIGEKIKLLINYLDSSRCLLILDNFESIMQTGESTGQYREGYTDYRKLINAIGERNHKSCLLLTSREKPQNLEKLAGEDRPVRFQKLEGLTFEDGQQIFTSIGISGSEQELKEVFNLYSGNPLFLDLAAKHIKEDKEFNGSISKFLKKAEPIIGQPLRDSEDERDAIRKMLDWYFQRLSNEQKEIMYWLAIVREAVSISQLKEDVLSEESKNKITTETLPSLQKRIPLETSQDNKYTLQNVLVEYMTDRLVEEVCNEIKTKEIGLLKSHALLKAQAADYVREIQIRLILEPLIKKVDDDPDLYIEEQLKKILVNLPRPPQSHQKPKPSYAAGNILNLLLQKMKLSLRESIQLNPEIKNYDFSNLEIRQAYLQDMTLHNVNFTNCNFINPSLTNTFGDVFCVAFSPDGKFVAAGNTDLKIHLWKLEGEQYSYNKTFSGHEHHIWSIGFSPDGSMIASGAEDYTVRLWDVNSSKCIKTFKNCLSGSFAFTPDGEKFAYVDQVQKIQLWDIANKKDLPDSYKYERTVTAMAFSPDGEKLAIASNDFIIRLWNVKNSELRLLTGHTEWIWLVAFNPKNENMLASASNDGTVRLWDLSTGESKIREEYSPFKAYSVAFSPDGTILASSSADRTIRLWDLEKNKSLPTLQGHTNWIRSIAFNPQDEKMLASGSDDKTIRLWDVNSGECLQILQGYNNDIGEIAFSPNGKLLAHRFNGSMLWIWDLESGNRLDSDFFSEYTNSKDTKKIPNVIMAIAFSPDSKKIATGGKDGIVRLWDIESGKCIESQEKHTDWIWSIAFSPDGSMIATGSEDYTVRLWTVSKNKVLCQCDPIEYPTQVYAVAFRPNQNKTILAFGGIHSETKPSETNLWNVNQGQLLYSVKSGFERTDGFGFIDSIAFSPDGKILAIGTSGNSNGEVQFWDLDLDPPKKLGILKEHKHQVYWMAFSSSGRIFASADSGRKLILWDFNQKKDLKTLEIDFQFPVALGENDKWLMLAIGNDDSKIQVLKFAKTEDGLIDLEVIEENPQTLVIPRPYEDINIKGVTGLNDAQKAALKALGAKEDYE